MTTIERDIIADGIEADRVAARLYWDPEVFAIEQQKIFSTYWMYLAHESEVPNRGDYVLKRISGQELIVTRGEHEVVNVLFNRCTHRGNSVCIDDCGNSRVFRCAYHGWTFNSNGDLRGVPHPDSYGDRFEEVRASLGLARPADCRSYRGFLFVRLEDSASTPSFDEFIAPAKPAIDRLCDLSPVGELQLTGGWLKHRMHCNWKMVAENQVDAYHAEFVHRSLGVVTRPGGANSDSGLSLETVPVRHLGMGHTELDFPARNRAIGRRFGWSGGVSDERVAHYVAAMRAAYGVEEADRAAIEGPPHTMLFPNVFLAEMNIMVIEPISPNETVTHTTPVLLAGGEELNHRTLLQFTGAMGPSGMIIADDVEISERNQLALHTAEPKWLDLSRGVENDRPFGAGQESPVGSDETAHRGIWAHYRSLVLR